MGGMNLGWVDELGMGGMNFYMRLVSHKLCVGVTKSAGVRKYTSGENMRSSHKDARQRRKYIFNNLKILSRKVD